MDARTIPREPRLTAATPITSALRHLHVIVVKYIIYETSPEGEHLPQEQVFICPQTH